MASDSLHAPRSVLSKKTLSLHQAIVSLMEELEAIDWYRQRADDCRDPALKKILLHNMAEEMEHACMVLEWIRRTDKQFAAQMQEILFKKGPISGEH